jgi:CRP/FNR family transcriptional regulator, anaerobic regulatory protein
MRGIVDSLGKRREDVPEAGPSLGSGGALPPIEVPAGDRAMKKPFVPASHLAPPLRAGPFLKRNLSADALLLTARQRADLAQIATRVRVPARTMIYGEGSTAEWVFAVAEGTVKSYRDLPSGKRIVAAFLFANDLFGLAENGLYLNSAQAITRATLFRLPVGELAILLKHDGEMQFQFLSKVTHELRESQRRAILINRRDAAGRLAMFVALMRTHADRTAKSDGQVPLPMTRSDIAGFLGLSLESVTRAATDLERRGLVKFEGRHSVRIVDAARLTKLVRAV